MCLVRNYRLQDIQLSKTDRRCSDGENLSTRLRWLAWPKLIGLVHSDQASQKRRLVENTGLEPVTSWLQTRRSPS